MLNFFKKLEREKPLVVIFLLSLPLVIIISSMYFEHTGRFLVREEEALRKLVFLLNVQSVYDFFPAPLSAQIDFAGHPGFHHFLLWVFTSLFGMKFLYVKIFNFIFSMSAVSALFVIQTKVNKNILSSLFLCLVLMSFNGWLVLSFQFYQDVFALSWSLWGLYFVLKNQFRIAGIFFTFSVLTLESYLAFPFCIIFFKILDRERVKTLSPLILPFIAISVFYLVNKIQTGLFFTGSMGMRWLNEDDTGIFRTLLEIQEGILLKITIHKIEIFLALLASFILYRKREELKEEKFLYKVFALVSFLFFVFYIFINESPLERDFLPFRLLCLFIIFSSLRLIEIESLSKLLLTLCAYGMVLVNANDHFSEYDETEVERQNDLVRLTRTLGEIPFETRYLDSAPQIYFSHPLFGLVNNESRRVKKLEEANIYVDPDLLLCFIPIENICQTDPDPNDSMSQFLQEFTLYSEDPEFKIYLKEQTGPI